MSNAALPRFLITGSVGFLLLLFICGNLAYAQEGTSLSEYYDKIMKENQSKLILIIGLLSVVGTGIGFFLFVDKRKKQSTMR